jgi:hypothetical protein
MRNYGVVSTIILDPDSHGEGRIRMDLIIEFDRGMATTVAVIELEDDGGFRVRCSPAIDVETLLALNRDIADRIVEAALAYADPPVQDGRLK